MNRPIVIFSYNRPQYFYHTLDSLKPQLNESTEIHLFQDGGRNYQNPQDSERERGLISDNIKMFKDAFPWGNVLASDVNFGVAFNQKRARDFIFKDHESAIFIEDDVILNNYYIKMLNERMDFFSEDRDISMVSCFGEPHRDKKIYDFLDYLIPNEDRKISQQENNNQYMQMEHVWAYGFFKHAYESVKDIMEGYYNLLPREYRARPHDKIYDYMKSCGVGNKIVSSQDSCLGGALTLKGFIRISTFTANMIYIGEWGEHSRPDNFKKDWGAQEVYSRHESSFIWNDEIKSKIKNRLEYQFLQDR